MADVNLTTFCPVGLGEPDVPALECLFRRLEANELDFGSDFHEIKQGKLDLCKQRLGPVYGSRLAESLRSNHTVQSLLLGADGLGPPGAEALGHALTGNSTLHTLFLGCNKIGPAGARALARYMVGNTALTGLWLKRNDIETEGLQAILQAMETAGTGLTTLDLVSNKLDFQGIKSLTAHLRLNTTLRYLYLGNNELTERECLLLATLLNENTPLKALYLSINPIGDAGIALLGEGLQDNTHLTELSVSSCAISDKGLAVFATSVARNAGLRVLDFGFRIGTKMLGAEPNYITNASVPVVMTLLEQNPRIMQCHLDDKVKEKACVEKLLADRRAAVPRSTWYTERPDLTAITSIYRGATKDKSLHPPSSRKRARQDMSEEELQRYARTSLERLRHAEEWQKEIQGFYHTELLRRSSSEPCESCAEA